MWCKHGQCQLRMSIMRAGALQAGKDSQGVTIHGQRRQEGHEEAWRHQACSLMLGLLAWWRKAAATTHGSANDCEG